VSLDLISERQTGVHPGLGLIRHWQAKKLRPRGALAPRSLFIGWEHPIAQIILVNSMESFVTVPADVTL
jgi:hypothetical protein